MLDIKQSPIQKNELKSYLVTKDFMVSKKEFTILKDEISGLLVTSPRPFLDVLGDYYKSETYISHTDANKTLLDKIYQRVKKYTLNQKLKLINSFNTQTKTILDVGCGTGEFLKLCQENNWQVAAVEPNINARTLAEKKLEIKIPADLLEIKNKQFDVISLWHVLEHVPNLNEYIIQLEKLLKPNGSLIIAVPNHESYDAHYYQEFWAAYDVPRHLWHFSKKSITLLFESINMKVVKIKPMKFDSFYVSLLSEKNKTGKSNPFRAFWIGLRSNSKAKTKTNYSSLIYVLKK
jgi:2-polyprenyl-3-methyl-5-hydroxy-6-metoxy-1,4-benzoquinol methylase